MLLLGKRNLNIFIVVVILVNTETVKGYINYHDIRNDEKPLNLIPEHARTTREILKMFNHWGIYKSTYTLQDATEHLLQYGALLRNEILDIFGSLVYDHYDDYSVGQTEALYRVYQETLERKYNIFDIVRSVLIHPDTRPTSICRYIHEHVHTCLKESSLLCTTIKKHDNPHPNTLLTPMVNITRRVYKTARISRRYPDGFSLPAILKYLKTGTLKLNVRLLSGLLHNIQYDSYDDEVRTAERNVMNILISESTGPKRLRILMHKNQIQRAQTVSELLKDFFERRKNMYDSKKNKNFAILSEHVIREVAAISSNIELFGTIYENNTIQMKYLLNLVLPPDVVDGDITEAKDYLLLKLNDFDIINKYLKVEKYQQSGPDQLLMEILGQMRDINFAVDLATALHVHARFWHQSHMINNLNELLELFDAYENLRNVPEFSRLISLMDKVRNSLWDSKNVTIEILCNNPRACLRIGLETVAQCALVNSEIKNYLEQLFLHLSKDGSIYIHNCGLPMNETEIQTTTKTTQRPTTTTTTTTTKPTTTTTTTTTTTSNEVLSPDLTTEKKISTTVLPTTETTSSKFTESSTLITATEKLATEKSVTEKPSTLSLTTEDVTLEASSVDAETMTTATKETITEQLGTEYTTTEQTTTTNLSTEADSTFTEQSTTDLPTEVYSTFTEQSTTNWPTEVDFTFIEQSTTDLPTEIDSIFTEESTTNFSTEIDSTFTEEATTIYSTELDSTFTEQSTTDVTDEIERSTTLINEYSTTETMLKEITTEKLPTVILTTENPITEKPTTLTFTTQDITTTQETTVEPTTVEPTTTEQVEIEQQRTEEVTSTQETTEESSVNLTTTDEPIMSTITDDDCYGDECIADIPTEITEILSSSTKNAHQTPPPMIPESLKTTMSPVLSTLTLGNTTVEDPVATTFATEMMSSSSEITATTIGKTPGLSKKPKTYSTSSSGEDCSGESCSSNECSGDECSPSSGPDTSYSKECSNGSDCQLSRQTDCNDSGDCSSGSILDEGEKGCLGADCSILFSSEERSECVGEECTDPSTAQSYLRCSDEDCADNPRTSLNSTECSGIHCSESSRKIESNCTGDKCLDDVVLRRKPLETTIEEPSAPLIRCDNKDPHYQRRLHKLEKIRIINALQATAPTPTFYPTITTKEPPKKSHIKSDHSDKPITQNPFKEVYNEPLKTHVNPSHLDSLPWQYLSNNRPTTFPNRPQPVPWHPVSTHSVQPHKFPRQDHGWPKVNNNGLYGLQYEPIPEIRSNSDLSNNRTSKNINKNTNFMSLRRYLMDGIQDANTPAASVQKINPSNNGYRNVFSRVLRYPSLVQMDDDRSQRNSFAKLNLDISTNEESPIDYKRRGPLLYQLSSDDNEYDDDKIKMLRKNKSIFNVPRKIKQYRRVLVK